MSIRHSFIASSLILAPIATLGFSSAAFADADSGYIELSGTVPFMINIAMSPSSAASSLPMNAGTSHVVKVADLQISSNNPSGVTITAGSYMGGFLGDGDGNSYAYNLAIIDDGASAALAAEAVTDYRYLNQPVTNFDATTGNKDMDLYLLYTLPAMPKAGTFTDVLTITVADN